MDRRQFLATAAATSAGALLAAPTTPARAADPAANADATSPDRPFGLDSPPVLQNPTPDGVTAAWAVSGPATGWVEYGPTKDLGRVARAAAGTGLLAYEPRFLSARLSGLTPGEPVYYRVVAAPIDFRGPYDIRRGEPVAGGTYRYVPPSASADRATFAVINDTHENEQTLKPLTAALAADPADLTVYNGDVFNDVRSDDQVVKCVLRPAGSAYAAERAVLFVPGNHDHRGVAARGLHRAFLPWPDEAPHLPRCFVVRHGPVAMVGLDTGEDKPDRHPAWAGLAAFEPYRAAQRDWLAAALKRPEVASAPFLVVFCHIPLCGRPGDNPGDTLEGYASYCRHAQQLWHPLIAAAGAQLVVSGHTHRHRYDAPAEGRPYGQLVGGGPQPERATLIRGRADRDRLEVTASALDGRELGRWTFAPRRPA
jgi:predicted phosphodiesterase